jgi:hypothetical protein
MDMKNIAKYGLLYVLVIIAFIQIMSLINPWEEGLYALKNEIPQSMAIVYLGGKTEDSHRGNFKRKDYLILPSFEIYRVNLVDNSDFIISERRGLLWKFLLTPIVLIIWTLFSLRYWSQKVKQHA